MPYLILASSSASRKKVLSELGLPFKVIFPNIDETQYPNEDPIIHVDRLSREKAQAVSHKIPKIEQALIIGADQICLYDGRIYGKPENAQEMYAWLKIFSGNTVRYISAITVLNHLTGDLATHRCESFVTYKNLSESHIQKYLNSKEYLNCSGGLKAESFGALLLNNVQQNELGSVLGLPILTLEKTFDQLGFQLVDFYTPEFVSL